MLDLFSNAYLYAQALDNSGDAEYWIFQNCGAQLEKLKPNDARLRPLRSTIDATLEAARCFSLHSTSIEGRSRFSGDCVLTIRPTTLDVNERVSPVLLVFNIYGGGRKHVTTAIRAIPDILGRNLSANANVEINKLERELAWPSWVQFFHLCFARVRSAKLSNLT